LHDMTIALRLIILAFGPAPEVPGCAFRLSAGTLQSLDDGAHGVLLGTNGSNPALSSGESGANLA
jgi:hypothetical protein